MSRYYSSAEFECRFKDLSIESKWTRFGKVWIIIIGFLAIRGFRVVVLHLGFMLNRSLFNTLRFLDLIIVKIEHDDECQPSSVPQ